MEVIFWVESSYSKENGWPSSMEERIFYQESKKLLESIGWKIEETPGKGHFPLATKGEEWLVLHPLYFHGSIAKDTPKKIAKVLLMASSFRYRQIEVIPPGPIMTGSEYLRKLRQQQPEMVEDIKKICDGVPEDEFVSFKDVLEKLEEKYHVARVGEIGEDVILKGVCINLCSVLLSCGELAVGITDNGETGFRTRKIQGNKKQAA